MISPATLRFHLAGLAVFGAIQLLPMLWPQIVPTAFCGPAAKLSSGFLGAPLLPGEPPVIALPALDVAVTEACSGFGFFSLLVALGAGLAARERRWRDFAWMLPAAYVVGLAANVSRIVCGVHVRLAADAFVPPSFANALHLAVGVAVFVTVLTLTWILTQRRYAHQP